MCLVLEELTRQRSLRLQGRTSTAASLPGDVTGAHGSCWKAQRLIVVRSILVSRTHSGIISGRFGLEVINAFCPSHNSHRLLGAGDGTRDVGTPLHLAYAYHTTQAYLSVCLGSCTGCSGVGTKPALGVDLMRGHEVRVCFPAGTRSRLPSGGHRTTRDNTGRTALELGLKTPPRSPCMLYLSG